MVRYWLPDARVVNRSEGNLMIASGDQRVSLSSGGAGFLAEVDDWLPRLGRREPALRVEVRPPRVARSIDSRVVFDLK